MKSKKETYLRFYDSSLSKQIMSYKRDPQKMLKETGNFQKNEILSGIIDARGKKLNGKIILKLPVKKTGKIVPLLERLFSQLDNKLGRHRGLAEKNRGNFLYWFFYLRRFPNIKLSDIKKTSYNSQKQH